MGFIKQNKKNFITVTILLLLTLCSIFIISKIATNPENYKSTIQSIDDKKTTVMSVTASAATISTLLATVPGDATTPIANQILQISSYLMIVVCVLVLEKSLLTVIGYLSFNFLMPVAFGLLGIYTFLKKDFLKILASKFILFAILIIAIIPISLKVGDMICDINSTTIQQVTETVNQTYIQSDNDNNTWFNNAVNKIESGISTSKDYAKQKLSQFIDVIAVFIIAYCVIPIIAVITVIALVKFIFGIKIPLKK